MDEHLNGAIRAFSRIYDLARETPLIHAPVMSEKFGQNIYLKREDLQDIFSFKIRGSYNRMLQMTSEELTTGVITCSAGNHGQGVAIASTKLGTSAVIIVPTCTPKLKIDRIKRLGGDVIVHGDNYDQASQKAIQMAEETGRTLIHPFDDPFIIQGNGTIGLELLKQMSGKSIDYIFVCIGGGGLIAGIMSVLKNANPGTKVIGVESYGSNSMSQSINKGEIVELDQVDTFLDGKAIKKVGIHTFRICQQYLDDIVLVSNQEVCRAIKDMYEERRIILEPAGAASLAGMVKYLDLNHIGLNRNLICVLTGANMDFNFLGEVIKQTNYQITSPTNQLASPLISK